MKITALKIIAGVIASLAAFGAHANCSGEPWLTLEVVAGELQGDGLAEFVEIDREGCVLSQYADFDQRAGQYQRQLDAAEQASLSSALDRSALMGYDPQAHRADRERAEQAAASRGGGLIHYVADADRVRLQIRAADGSVQLIEWPSPELYSELDPGDLRLARLADFVRRLRSEGADTRRSRLPGVSP